MAKPKNEDWDLGNSWESFRINENDALFHLLEGVEQGRAEFIRTALLKYYEGKLLVDCPTCEGEKIIFSGAKAKGSTVKSKKQGSRSKSKVYTFRTGTSLQNDLAKEKDKAETIKMSLAVILSKEHELECPTCRGVGKVIGGPKIRRAVLAKL